MSGPGVVEGSEGTVRPARDPVPRRRLVAILASARANGLTHGQTADAILALADGRPAPSVGRR